MYDHVTHMVVRLLAVLLSQSLCWSSGAAQEEFSDEPWRWSTFTTESGLPSDVVWDVMEAADGTLWAETSDGIAWYDGFQWHPVPGTGSSGGKPADVLCGFKEDSVLIYRSGEQVQIGNKHGFRTLIKPASAGAVPFGEGGYLTTRDGSPYLLHDGVIKAYEPEGLETTARTLNALPTTRSGASWLNLVAGIYRYENDAWNLTFQAGSRPLWTIGLRENSAGEGLAFIEKPVEMRGLWQWDRQSAPARVAGEPIERVRALDISDQGEAIVLYESGVLRMFTGGVWSTVHLQSRVRDIQSFRFLGAGDLWIGTERGLVLYRRSRPGNEQWTFPDPGRRQSVNEIFLARDGSLWLATDLGVEIRHLGGTTETVRKIDTVMLHSTTGLGEDSVGGVWISSGSSFSGTFRWDGARWTHHPISNSEEVFVHKIRKDRRGRLWFLGLGRSYPPYTQNQPGAYLLSGGNFSRWGEGEISSGRVYAFDEGPDGALWFGTYAGLSRWLPGGGGGKGAWTHWGLKEGLRVERVYTLVVDRNNTVWIGHGHVDDAGLGRLDSTGRIRYFGTADGLVNARVWDLKIGPAGELWIATDQGLSLYDRGIWTTFDKQSGLHFGELWPVLPLADRVYVGARWGGLGELRRIDTLSPAPRVVIKQPIVEGSSVIARWIAFAWQGEAAPADVQTRYRLDGGEWSGWAKKREFSFTNLSSGGHVLQVQASGVYGNFDEGGGVVAFDIPPPLLLRPAALIPLVISVAGIMTLGLLLIVRNQKHSVALKASEKKFRTATENSSSAIIIFTEDRTLFMNQAARVLTGFTINQLPPVSIRAMVHPDHRGAFDDLKATTRGLTAPPGRSELLFLRQDGGVWWGELTISTIEYSGRPAYLATVFNITEQREAWEQLQANQAQIRSLVTELSITEERERRRMAVYLHDIIGQSLVVSKMRLREMATSPGVTGLDKPLAEVRALIDQSIADTRALTFDLCPPMLYELPFEAAVRTLASETLESHSINFRFRDDDIPKPLTMDVRIVLFHSCKELLHNVVKHSGAGTTEIILSREGSYIVITVQDDGNGIGVHGTTPGSGTGGRFGLFSIRERLAQLGGSFEFDSHNGIGTRAVLRAPLDTATPPLPPEELK